MVEEAPTYTRLTTTSPMDANHLYWLIFSYNKGVQAHVVDVGIDSLASIDRHI